MKVIFAQGNPGTQYAATRHNVGWIILDAIAKTHGVEFKRHDKFFADIALFNIRGEKIMLVKPLTFYNETGRAARAIIDFYKLNPEEDFLVIHDDLSLPFGTIRVRNGGSSAGNNGIKSLSSHLGDNYTRVRIGIWSDTPQQLPHIDIVLGRLSTQEQVLIKGAIVTYVETLISGFSTEALAPTSYSIT